MDWFRRIPMGALVIVVGTISVIGWITLEGTIPLVISIIAGGLIALRGTLGDEDKTP
jgi:hypothetical protein